MGLSSSQARLLTLTSRMHDIEYKAAKLEAQKLQMANESRKVYEDYLIALDATKIQKKTINEKGAADYVDATYNTLIAAGYKIKFLEEFEGTGKPQLINEIVPQTSAPTYYKAITTAADFLTELKGDRAGNYILMADLDFSGVTISDTDLIQGFSGTLDGNGHSIKNLNINLDKETVGLFVSTEDGAVIKNLIVDNASVNGCSGWEVGILIGNAYGNITIDNCNVTGTVSGGGWIGGIIADCENATITNTCSDIVINATDSQVGGFIGHTSGSATITDSFVSGSITGDYAIGGFVGSGEFTGTGIFENCYSTCTIAGNYDYGSIYGGWGLYQDRGNTYTMNYYDAYNPNPINPYPSYGGQLITQQKLDELIDNGTLKGATPSVPDECKNSTEWLANMINAGAILILKPDKNGNYFETSVAIDTGLQEVSDESLLRKAEAKYEADMRKIDAKDKKYDTELAAIDNERNAVKAEMETLKTVAKDNVERTFKLFS